MQRTTDDFGMTVSSNKLSEDVIRGLHDRITDLHKDNIALQID